MSAGDIIEPSSQEDSAGLIKRQTIVAIGRLPGGLKWMSSGKAEEIPE
jgi:hypothetical protein